MSGYECGNSEREMSQMMDLHMERVIYKPWFKHALTMCFCMPVDVRNVHTWTGSVAPYFMRPGRFRKYITLVFRFNYAYDCQLEQNSLDDNSGVITLIPLDKNGPIWSDGPQCSSNGPDLRYGPDASSDSPDASSDK